MGLFTRLFGRRQPPIKVETHGAFRTPKVRHRERPHPRLPPLAEEVAEAEKDAPRSVPGLRGAAMGTIVDWPHGAVPASPEGIGPEEIDAFLDQGQWLAVNSSWIAAFRYDAVGQVLTLRTIKPNREGNTDYDFPDVTYDMAQEMTLAFSKGGWVWDALWHYVRTRGPFRRR